MRGPEDSEWMASLDQWLFDCAEVGWPEEVPFEDDEAEQEFAEQEAAFLDWQDAMYDMWDDQ